MKTTSQAETPPALLFGRHIVGMALFALLNPLIYYSNEPVARWFSIWAGAVAFALACFGLYALFFTAKAKEAWPKSFFTLAWVFVVLITMEPYISDFNERPSESSAPQIQQQPAEQLRSPSVASDDEWWKKGSTPVHQADEQHPGLKPFTGKLDGE